MWVFSVIWNTEAGCTTIVDSQHYVNIEVLEVASQTFLAWTSKTVSFKLVSRLYYEVHGGQASDMMQQWRKADLYHICDMEKSFNV